MKPTTILPSIPATTTLRKRADQLIPRSPEGVHRAQREVLRQVPRLIEVGATEMGSEPAARTTSS